MKQKIITVIDFLLIPICFLFLLSSCVKIVSSTFLWNIIVGNQKLELCILVLFAYISFTLTPLLHREIQALRLPLADWLRLHRLR